jgi:hypothetical protein
MSEEIKEDFLEVDPKIPGQNYVCLSFVSPEKVLKQKEVFYATRFLHHLLTEDDLPTRDLRNRLVSYDVSSSSLSYDTVFEAYEDWKYSRKEKIEEEFYEKNNFQTTVRGVKIRGTYDTHKEASVRAQVLRKKDPSFNVYVGQVGYWLPFDPDTDAIQEQEYQENMLNELVKKYKDNLESRDNMYEQIKIEKIKQAKKENEERKEKLKSEENSTVTDITEEDISNLNNLREIVNESDSLFYENMKKSTEEVAENVSSSSEVKEESSKESTPDLFEPKPVIMEDMSRLEDEDPWMKRKKEMNA